MEKIYTREELLSICEKAFTSEENWQDRDSAISQRQLGECYSLIKDGCDFKIIYDDSNCSTNEETIWVEVYSKGFRYFEYYDSNDTEEENNRNKDSETYYLPTIKRLEEANGGDWY